MARAERGAMNGLDDAARIQEGLFRFSVLVRGVAARNVFYRQLWADAGLDLSLQDLRPADFPIVSKAQIRPALVTSDILNSPLTAVKAIWLKTTGSTGEPFVFPIDREGMARREASRVLAREGYGHSIGDSMVSVWRGTMGKIRWKERLINWLHGEVRICVFDPDRPVESALSDDRLNEILDRIEGVNPKHVDGYASALALLARFHLGAQRYYMGSNLKTVITGAEVLSDEDRSDIQRFFGVPVMNRYGGTESSLIAHQFLNEDGQVSPYLRVCSEKLLVEIVDEQGRYVEPGEIGRVILTDFTNNLMPLVRYDVGDFARGLSKGIQFGLVEVVGRKNTFFRNRDGNLISTHIWQNYLRSSREISAFLLEQKTLDDVCLYVKLNEPSNASGSAIADLKQKIQFALPGVALDVKYVEQLPVGPGGKHIQCVSHVL